MDLPGEQQCPIDADHHGICKFENRQDPRYESIRGILSRLISAYDCRQYIIDMEKLAVRLFIEEPDFQGLETRFQSNDRVKSSRRFQGEYRTCRWLLDQECFTSWLNNPGDNPHVLWITGSPAAGKSTLATYVVDLIRERVGDSFCLYHQFVSSNQSQRTPSYLLRSFAFQAAAQLPNFREELLLILSSPVSLIDVEAIWENVFRGILFRQTLSKPLYWVIDGLDESKEVPALFRCMRTLDAHSSIRVLLLGRPDQDVSTELKKISMGNHEAEMCLGQHHITQRDTDNDMRRLVGERLRPIIPSTTSHDDIIECIIQRASGNFLWVSLIIKDLKASDCATVKALQERLNHLPIEMNEYYSKMISKIKENNQFPDALATILMWTTFSSRPLHIREMQSVLQMHVPGSLPLPVVEDLVKCCGDLIHLGSTGTLTLVHHTARQFLKEHSCEILSQSPAQSHAHLAVQCLKYLSSQQIDLGWRNKLTRLEKEIQEQDAGKSSESLTTAFRKHYPLLQYAAQFWAIHLNLANPESRTLWSLLHRFLDRDCLTWINTLALLRDLNTLIHAAQHLQAYMKKLKECAAKELGGSKLVDEAGILKLWTRDWIKVVGTLGSNIVENPTSIYDSVLPFCPTNSIMRRTYGMSTPSSLTVAGSAFEEWSGCDARLSIKSESTISKVYATAAVFAALVPQERCLVVWDARTYEELHRILHGEYVKDAAVNKKGDLVATCGQKTIKIWNLNSGKELAVIDNQGNDIVMALQFGASDEEILVGYQNHLVVIYNWKVDTAVSFLVQQEDISYQGLHAVNFSPDGTRVAVSSRTSRVELWDIRKQKRIRQITPRNEAHHDKGHVFNPAGSIQWHPTSAYLFLLYHSMNLVYCNAEFEHQIEHDDIQANVILCSPCGNFLLTSHYSRSVKVYSIPDYSDRETQPTFTLLYHLECSEYMWDFAWSPDGERIYEVRDSICSVWAPVELVLPDGVNPEERRLQVANQPIAKSVTFVSSNKHITAIANVPNSGIFCYARDDGLLNLDMTGEASVRRVRALKGHFADAIIGTLTWSQSGNFLASADDSGHVLIHKILIASPGSKQRNRFYRPSSLQLRASIKQLLFSPDDLFLLISTSTDDVIWDISKKKVCQKRKPQVLEQAKWILHPTDSASLVSISSKTESHWTWAELINPPSSLFFALPDTANHAQMSDLQPRAHQIVLDELDRNMVQRRDLRILISEVLRGKPGDQGDKHALEPVIPLLMHVNKLVGHTRDKIVFFNKSNWVCIWEIGSMDYEVHLQLPNIWVNSETLELSVLGLDGALLCPRNGEVAIVKNWIKEQHDVRLVSLAP